MANEIQSRDSNEMSKFVNASVVHEQWIFMSYHFHNENIPCCFLANLKPPRAKYLALDEFSLLGG